MKIQKKMKPSLGIIFILFFNFICVSAFGQVQDDHIVIVNGKKLTPQELANIRIDEERVEREQDALNEKEAQAKAKAASVPEIKQEKEVAKADEAGTIPEAVCKKYKAEKEAKNPFAQIEASKNYFPGSNEFMNCDIMTKGTMKDIFKNGNRYSGFDWMPIIEAACLNDPKVCDIKTMEKCTKSNSLKAARCDAAAFIISDFGREWNAENAKGEKKSGGNPPIECKSSGVETVDYEPCVKFISNGELMDAAQAAVQTGQQLYYQDKVMTAQADAASSTNTATAALKAQGASLTAQKDVMTQRAALDTGKFAALATYYSEIPSSETLTEKCSHYKSPKFTDANYASFTDQSCSLIIRGDAFNFLYNQPARDKMKVRLVGVGINVGTDAMMAALAAKQARSVNDAIAKVDAFKPIDPTAPAVDNLQTTYCQQNPGDAKCLTGGLDRTFDAMGDNIVNFGEGGSGTIYTPTPFVDPTAGTVESGGGSGGNTVGGVGSVIPAAQQNGGLANIAPEAKVTKGAPPSGGGSGGGGGGGSLGAGGGGGAPGGQAQGGTSAAIQGKTPNYGGGGGTLSMMGGYGINKSKSTAKDDSNPFGKLFNKDGSKSVNFRDIASQKVGTKGDNIFEMISKRYSSVNNDKRLLEYEMTK